MIIATISIFVAGLTFAIGLGLSGMTQPEKVVAFLDILGSDWDPSLAFVMAGAVSVYFVAHRLVLKREKPVAAEKFGLPTRIDIDLPLIAGAALFGTGWGLLGLCPGPALVASVTGNPKVLVFLVSMSLGMFLYGSLNTRFSREPDGGMGAFELLRSLRGGSAFNGKADRAR